MLYFYFSSLILLTKRISSTMSNRGRESEHSFLIIDIRKGEGIIISLLRMMVAIGFFFF